MVDEATPAASSGGDGGGGGGGAPACYYDPHAKCIKYTPHDHEDGIDNNGTVTLSGVIVDVVSPDRDKNSNIDQLFAWGRVLRGEIIDIIDPSLKSNRETKEDDTTANNIVVEGAGGLLTRACIDSVLEKLPPSFEGNAAKDNLRQKQRQLQTAHANEVQQLIHKHKKDRSWFSSQLPTLRLERGAELEEELQTIHAKESVNLHIRQQTEQNELLDLVFGYIYVLLESRMELEKKLKENEEEHRDQLNGLETKLRESKEEHQNQLKSVLEEARQLQLASQQEAQQQVERERAQAVHAEVVQPSDGAYTPTPVISTPQGVSADKTTPFEAAVHAADAPSSPPLKSDATSSRKESSTKPPLTPEAASLPERISKDRKKADEIKAAMRDSSLSREERKAKLDEIKRRYSGQATGTQAHPDREASQDEGGKPPPVIATPNRDIAKQKRSELQDVMKDHSLSREEKQERMAAINAKYASAIQRHHTRQEAHTKINEMKAKVALNKKKKVMSHSTEDPVGSSDASSRGGRWKMSGDQISVEEEESEDGEVENQNESKQIARNRWQAAAVKSVTANTLSSYRVSKGNINKPKSNEEKDDLQTDDRHEDQVESDDKEHDEMADEETELVSKRKALSTRVCVSDLSNDSHDLVFDHVKDPPKQDVKPEKIGADPFEGVATNRTPMKKLVKNLSDDDPSLLVLKLDGRKKVKDEDWEALFESLEGNTKLTHLSISRCELTDEIAVSLVLGLVENENLEVLRLNSNNGITDDTAKGFIKVLLQSNKTLKRIDLARTRVSKKSVTRLTEILGERDEEKQKERMRKEREAKIKALLAFSAGDQVSKENADEVADEQEEQRSTGSVSSKLSASLEEQSFSLRSRGSITSSKYASSKKSSRKKRGVGRGDSASNYSGSSRRPNARTVRGGRGGRGNGVRASMAAKQMAQLGGDIASVGDQAKLRETRKLRGECETCGQKCFQKTMFKTTPMTIPNAVFEGRCLKCNPM